MGIKCPKCGSTNTIATGVGKMFCRNCSRAWKPYKHRGKKMKTIGDGFITPKRKVMPGAKTKLVGDDFITPKKRVKKKRKKKENIFGF